MPKRRRTKVKDKWGKKEWYDVIAPVLFNQVKIGETLADDPDKLLGRITETTLHELTGDLSKMHVKLQFKVNDVREKRAHTYFIGHELASDYIRRLVRKRRSKVDSSCLLTTKDGSAIRVKPLAVTGNRIQTRQKSDIRLEMEKVLRESAKARTLGKFISEMISGKLPAQIFNRCKAIYPLKRVEIRKSEVVKTVPLSPAEKAKLEGDKPEAKEAKAPAPDAVETTSGEEIPAPEAPVEAKAPAPEAVEATCGEEIPAPEAPVEAKAPAPDAVEATSGEEIPKQKAAKKVKPKVKSTNSA